MTPKWIHLTRMRANWEIISFLHKSLTIITREETQVFRQMGIRMRNFTRILSTLWTLLDIVTFQRMWTIIQTFTVRARISAIRNSHYHRILRLMEVVGRMPTQICSSIELWGDSKELQIIKSLSIVPWAQWKPCLLKMTSWIPFKSIIIRTKLKLTLMVPTSKCLVEHKSLLWSRPRIFLSLFHKWGPKTHKIKFIGLAQSHIMIICKDQW